jgi:hypothetical protein
MQLSNETIAILKNFSSINQSILLREGNVLKTISPAKNIMAKAVVSENFPKEVAIYDLNRLLGVVSLFKSHDLDFTEHHIAIADGKNSVKYVYADPSIIVAAPAKEINLPSTEVNFTITEDQMQSVLKAAGVVGVPDVSFVGDGSTLVMKAHDKKTPTSNEYAIEIGETDQVFSVDYKVENFKMVPGDYEVSISKKLISKFKGAVEYFVACESTSTFQ